MLNLLFGYNWGPAKTKNVLMVNAVCEKLIKPFISKGGTPKHTPAGRDVSRVAQEGGGDGCDTRKRIKKPFSTSETSSATLAQYGYPW